MKHSCTLVAACLIKEPSFISTSVPGNQYQLGLYQSPLDAPVLRSDRTLLCVDSATGRLAKRVHAPFLARSLDLTSCASSAASDWHIDQPRTLWMLLCTPCGRAVGCFGIDPLRCACSCRRAPRCHLSGRRRLLRGGRRVDCVNTIATNPTSIGDWTWTRGLRKFTPEVQRCIHCQGSGGRSTPDACVVMSLGQRLSKP
eukprot:COSAG02_NODE_25392_length_660_cov_0.782531_1_plen_198_part_01